MSETLDGEEGWRMEDQDLSFGQAESRLWVKWVLANFVATWLHEEKAEETRA